MIRTLIVDEHRITGTVLSSVLAEESDVEIVAVVTSVQDALEHLDTCDIMVVSTSITEEAALEIARSSIASEHSARTLIIGIPESEDVILRYIEAGAAGFVLKDDTVEGLLETLRAVYNGEAILPPNLTARLMSKVVELARAYEDVGGVDNQLTEELTRREQEVLDLISDGRTNQEIADTLIIELGTVKNHVHNILKKLNVSSRREAAMIFQMNNTGPQQSLKT